MTPASTLPTVKDTSILVVYSAVLLLFARRNRSFDCDSEYNKWRWHFPSRTDQLSSWLPIPWIVFVVNDRGSKCTFVVRG